MIEDFLQEYKRKCRPISAVFKRDFQCLSSVQDPEPGRRNAVFIKKLAVQAGNIGKPGFGRDLKDFLVGGKQKLLGAVNGRMQNILLGSAAGCPAKHAAKIRLAHRAKRGKRRNCWLSSLRKLPLNLPQSR